MNSFQEIITQALNLRVQLDDLRSATYTVVTFEETSGPTFLFIASFNIETMNFHYAITDANWIEVKTLSQLQPETLAAYGDFVSKMIAFTKGEPHPYKDNIVGNNSEAVKSPHDMAKATAFVDDSNIDDSEASLR